LQTEQGVTFVARRMAIDFRAPARLDDAVVVETAVATLGGASLTLMQRVMRGADVLVEAEVSCAVLSHATGRPARLPPEVRARLAG
jgi:acyl-CoA thioester hydrolase